MTRISILLLVCLCAIAPYGNAATPKAIDAEIVDGESAVYVLFDDGFVQTAGTAVNLGSAPGTDAVDLTLTSTQKGYYILDGEGNVYSYGDAIIIANPLGDSSGRMVDMELMDDGNSQYFLKDTGEIITSKNAKFHGNLIKDGAVDLELAIDGLGYYTLYEDGTLAFFGSAIDLGYSVSGSFKAIDLEILDEGYYVTYDNGTVLNFGGALPLPFTPSPDSAVTDMVMTENGYRLLTAEGALKSFRQINNQGQVSWYAQVELRAVAPQATATPTPPPDAQYFKFERTGFTEKIVGSLPENVAIPEFMTTGQASTFGGGVFIATSDGEDQPARAIRLYSLEDTASNSNLGETFVSLNANRGDAEIRGLSYSRAGLYVTVKDVDAYLIFLLEGDFESADVSAYMLH